ncbi:hypothetical protein BGX38DRAFT_1160870, partial [Terfezia claveryi]
MHTLEIRYESNYEDILTVYSSSHSVELCILSLAGFLQPGAGMGNVIQNPPSSGLLFLHYTHTYDS